MLLQQPPLTFDAPTDSEPELIGKAFRALREIFRPGFRYRKTGVLLLDLVPANSVQLSLLDTVDREKHTLLMHTLDSMRERYGHSSVKYAAQGVGRAAGSYGRRTSRPATPPACQT